MAIPENYTNFITVAFAIGFVFQFWLYRMRHDWWKKYVFYLFSGGDQVLEGATYTCYFSVTQIGTIMY